MHICTDFGSLASAHGLSQGSLSLASRWPSRASAGPSFNAQRGALVAAASKVTYSPKLGSANNIVNSSLTIIYWSFEESCLCTDLLSE